MTDVDTRGPVIVRPVRHNDAGALWDLLAGNQADTVGMTSLPRTAEATATLCAQSADTLADLATGSFDPHPGEARRLLFVAVDAHDPTTPIGLTGLVFKIGLANFAVTVTTNSDGQGLIMQSSSRMWTRCELGSTYLAPIGRGRGLGTLLSRGRFMFMHLVHHQIPTGVVSHLRGRFNDDGTAPFWECFGAVFAPQWLTSIDAEHALEADPGHLDEFVGMVVPLTAPVLHSLGQVNKDSVPAYHLLTTEGLRPNGMYDPIDGGPTIEGELTDMATYRRRVRGRAVIGRPGVVDALVAAASIDRFWVTRSTIERGGVSPARPDQVAVDQIGIDAHLADAIGIEPDTLLTASPLTEEA